MGKSKANRLVEELLKAIDVIGLDKTIDTLEYAQTTGVDHILILQEFIIKTSCDAFSITRAKLLCGKSDRNKTNAIATSSYFLSNHLGYSQAKISSVVKKDNSVISKYIKRINNLDTHHLADQEMLLTLNRLNKQIKDFKTKLQN